jgi:hypothetical protein
MSREIRLDLTVDGNCSAEVSPLRAGIQFSVCWYLR